jgi:ATP-dependent helicase YprA (DUF1998 family)
VSELLPSAQARRITDGLLDYLTTTFALADPDAQLALNEFLSNREHGIFKGPFLRLRLPFRTAEDGWQSVLGWKIGIKPHGHQAETFRRLSSADLGPDKQEPLPTLVTTGTGSGKTEAFLYPILDHVLRARRDGVTGMKALILYPMNALANDQAQRLADLITTRPELAGITAGLYTGQKGPERTKVSADGLITDRLILRDEAPDILLTNYKMLDQLLLRHDDARIWKQSAASLQYLVLDEFHTYDGAQGTDVAMLLRRLGLTIKSHLPDGALTEEEEARPLGKITPVATSATLGDKDDPSTMVGFASTVFGTKFGADSVVTETRRGLAEWTAGAADTVADIKPSVVPRRPMRADLAQINAAVVALSRGNGPGDDAGQESTGSGSGSWGSAGGGDAAAITFAVLGGLYELAEEIDPEGKGIVKKDGRSPAEVIREAVGDGPEKLLALVKAHPLVEELVPATERATHLGELAAVFWPESSAAPATGEEDDRIVFLTHLVAALSHVRLVAGHEALSVDLHLWVRELSRIDRVADSSASYRWSDDGETAGLADFGAEGVQQQAFPAIYCRLCGRSGWGVGLASVGSTLDADDTLIRRRKASGEGRFRALIYAPNEAEHELAAREAADDPDTPPGDRESKTVEGLRWFSVRQRVLLAKAPDDDDKDFRDGLVLPVLTQIGDDADDDSRDDVCPSCRRKDGIRFLGSAVATLLSVTLSTVFGDGELDSAEKKALVFTDSVQDSAHRAGFVGSRSHTLTLRAVLRQAVGDDMVSLDELVSRAIAAARDDPFGRYRMLPPDLVETKEFRAFWESERARDVPQPVRRRVRKRLLFDALLEFGLQSGFARTLEQTGSALAEVAAGEPQALAQMAREVLGTTEEPGALFGVADHVAERWLIAWVRGVLEHMRSDGAIEHDWFGKFIKSDGNRYFIWGGRPRGQGMPAFPKGRSAPEFPRVGPPAKGKDPLLVQVTSPQSWYARWTGQVLGVPPGHGARLARQLLERLARADILRTMATDSGGTVFAIPVTSVVVGPSDLADMRAGDTLLACDVCRTPHPAAPVSAAQLDGAPCLLVRCPGTLRRTSREDNYYRRLYASADMRRIVAREHTSLIPDKTRLEYEREFRQSVSSPNAPNVLVATPTLEMGIDIGDLSAVLLASLPKTVASYLQRVGRAGRLTGSALNLAFVTGRGEQLPRLEDPLSVINGKVRAPATYLSAEEILRRQYTAHLADCFAREESRPHPRRARIAIGSAGPGTFLGELIRFAEEDSDAHLDRFLSGFTGLADAAVDSLRAWAAPVGGEPSSSGLAMHLCDASRRWAATIEELKYRRTAITKAMRDLEKRAANPAATDDDKRAVVTATATLRMIGFESRRLNGQHWIAVLEEYGILPNYTLLDDSAVLDVSVSWIDPDTQKFETRPESFARSGVGALREFAPGATFYANKLEILIDAVDLGPDDSLVRTMAFCPNCGYAADLSGADPHSGNRGTSAPLACPRCGAVGVSGMENRLDVVDMRQVSAQVRRDEAVITDRSDQRVTEPFQIAIAPDIDPAFIARQWYLDGYDFGVKYLRRMVIRWVNLGRARRGPSREIAGEQATAPLFRVCSACGVLDRDAGANRPEEHRAWCRYRTDPDEHTRTIALGRTLTTQGAAIRLPRSVTVGDPFALPSLAAALLLGLHEQIGGSPDHIGIEQIHEPAPGERGVTGEALLLHDLVPGGTGYLAELAAPERMHDLLRRAWEKVRDCPCQHEPRLACHRCLIPFAPTRAGGLTFVSRVVAERHLRTILTGGDPSATPAGTMDWTLTSEEPPISSTESHLEQSFRKLFAERVEALGATVKETPGPLGNRMTIIFPSGERQWILEPQVTMGSSRPDFVLGSSQATIPPVAIFIDGWRYHASALHNRLADDARKRQDLRDGGAIVLGITHRDIDQAHENARTAPPWLNDSILGELMGATGAFRQRDTDAIRYGPVSFLLDWLQDPDPGGRRALADYLPYLFAQGSRQLQLSPAADLTREAALLLADPHHEPASEDSTAANPASMSWWWSNGTAGLLARATGEDFASLTIETVLVVDDRAETLADHDRSEDGWREWLRISNALVLRDQPTVITTLTDASVGAGEAGEKLRGVRKIEFDLVLDSDWQAARGLAESAAERAFLDGLAQATVTPQGSSLPAPEVGYETGDGLPVDFAWPDARIAVFLDLEDDDSRVLELPGWRVFGNDRDAVAAALREAA